MFTNSIIYRSSLTVISRHYGTTSSLSRCGTLSSIGSRSTKMRLSHPSSKQQHRTTTSTSSTSTSTTETTTKKSKGWWYSAELWGGAGALAGWGMSGSASYVYLKNNK